MKFAEVRERVVAGSAIFTDSLTSFEVLDEQACCYNNRHFNDADRLDIAVRQIVGKRLTWDRLTGKEEEARATVN